MLASSSNLGVINCGACGLDGEAAAYLPLRVVVGKNISIMNVKSPRLYQKSCIHSSCCRVVETHTGDMSLAHVVMLSRLIRSSSLLPTPNAIRPPTHNLDKINHDVELVPDDTRHRRVDAVYGAAQRLEVDVRADLRTKRSQNAARDPFFFVDRWVVLKLDSSARASNSAML